MAIVCIKIGENEPETYPKFAGLSKHMDIIDVLPRKQRTDRTIGNKGDKHYFGLNVDMSHLNDVDFGKMRYKLREIWYDDPQAEHPIKIARRLRQIDLSKVSLIGISQQTVDNINQKGNQRRQKQEIDMMEINRYDIVVPFNLFVKIVVNKKTGQTLEEELNG